MRHWTRGSGRPKTGCTDSLQNHVVVSASPTYVDTKVQKYKGDDGGTGP